MRHFRKDILVATLLLAAGRPAEAQCPAAVQARAPADVAERIDRYRFEPRRPDTYRALAGLGDPGVEPEDHGSYYWNRPVEADDRELLRQMLPDQRGADEQYWYPDPGGCRLDYALEVAGDRAAQLGRNHPYVAAWLRAQRAVFTVCRNQNPWGSSASQTEAAPRVTLPPPMPSTDPAVARLQRHDRAYQGASIRFYRGDPGTARAFRAIAASASPHAPIARYMLVALEARDVDRDTYNEPPPIRAERIARAHRALAGARAILADASLAEVHPLAQGLIGFLGYWTGDDRVREAQIDATLDALAAPLARIAADPVARERYGRAAHDIAWLRRDFRDEGLDLDAGIPASSAARALAARARRDPFAAWLVTAVSPFERESWATPGNRNVPTPSTVFAAEELGVAAGNRAWEVVRSSFAADYDPQRWAAIDALVGETQACPSDDRLAAVGPLFYHQVRSALMYPERGEDYEPLSQQQGFAQALERVSAWPWRESRHHRELVSDMLHFLAARGRLDEARTVRDRLDPRAGEDAWQNSAALLLLAEDEDQFVREVAAAPDAQQPLVNLLPVEALARLAGREDLPLPVRARFARVAWARLYARERRVPRDLDRLMRRLNPEITGDWASRPGARPTNTALLLDVLRSPGLNIVIAGHQRGGEVMGYGDDPGLTRIDTFEHSDNNWWCAWQPDRHRITASAILYGAFFRPWDDWDPMAAAGATTALGPLLRGSWLWQAQDPAEQEALARIPSAPQLLAERAVAWRGRRAGQDEALALAVRATRYGCQRQGGHGAWSRAAHALLHRRFPTSDAARRTRWWFDCSHFTGGCDRQRQEIDAGWERWARERWD